MTEMIKPKEIPRLMNAYTEAYEEFKKIPDEQRDAYCQEIVKTPQDDEEHQYPCQPPTYFHTLPVLGEDKEIIDICLYTWEPRNLKSAKGIMFIFHGINAHIGTLSELASFVKDHNNLIVIGHDVRNFGKSGGLKRGYLEDIDEIMGDCEKMVAWAVEKYGRNQQIFLTGFSMGAGLAIRYANMKLHNFAGVVLLNPGLQPNPAGTHPISILDKVKILAFPHTYLFKPDFNNNCRHRPLVKKLQEDPLIYHGKVWSGTLGNIHSYAKEVRDSAQIFDFPYLFMMCGNDKGFHPFQIVDFDRKSPSKDKTHLFVRDGWHSVFIDKNAAKIIPIVSEWIAQRQHN